MSNKELLEDNARIVGESAEILIRFNKTRIGIEALILELKLTAKKDTFFDVLGNVAENILKELVKTYEKSN